MKKGNVMTNYKIMCRRMSFWSTLEDLIRLEYDIKILKAIKKVEIEDNE